MSYSAEISRTNPACFLFLIDQSGSMSDNFGNSEVNQTKADFLADAINKLIQNLVIRCAKDEGVRDYFHVGVIGYGSDVGPAFGGALTGRKIVPISEVANMPLRVEERTKKIPDGAGGLVDQTIKFPVWFDSKANNGTPMSQALELAHTILSEWTLHHANSYPPVVINITDGESTDGDPSNSALKLCNSSTTDGSTLLINNHLSSTKSASILFPGSESLLPDLHSKLMFRISSLLTSQMRSAAKEHGIAVSEDSRGFVYNSDATSLIQFLDIGTRASNLR